MSALPNFDPQTGIINIRQLKLLSLYFDFEKGPVAKKLREVFKEKKKRQGGNIANIIREVAEANKCQTVEYKRSGKRKWLWGLYEAEPEEKLSISIRGHYCSLGQT